MKVKPRTSENAREGQRLDCKTQEPLYTGTIQGRDVPPLSGEKDSFVVVAFSHISLMSISMSMI